MNKKEYLQTKEGRKLLHEGIKDIEFTLENCEIIRIPREDIGCIIVKDFEKVFNRTAINDISLNEIAKYVIVQIKNSTRTYKEEYTIGVPEKQKEISLLERLKIPDITSICIHYLWDDESYFWLVDWDNDYSDEINKLQTVEENYSDIWIAIGEKAQAELSEYFPADLEVRNSIWDMYNLENEEN